MLEPLTCPQCGAPLRAGANKCDYCDTGFVGADAQVLINQVENKIQTLRFEISAQEMSSAIARFIDPHITHKLNRRPRDIV